MWRGFAALVLVTLAGLPTTARAEGFPLTVRVIHAKPGPVDVEAGLEDIAKQLEPVKLRYVKLLDSARFDLVAGAAGRMQLPNKEWLAVTALGPAEGTKLRVEITVEKLEFKATVAIDLGATVAVRGPSFREGTMVLAISRPGPR